MPKLLPINASEIEIDKTYLFHFSHSHTDCEQDILTATVLLIELPYIIVKGPWRNIPIDTETVKVFPVSESFSSLFIPKKRLRRSVAKTKTKTKTVQRTPEN